MKNELPSAEILHELFELINGSLYHRARARDWFISDGQQKIWHARFCGKKAGKINSTGHVQVRIKDKLYLAHRIVWAMHHGAIGVDDGIDHINEVKTDNRIANLRLANARENRCNVGYRASNKSGYKGVWWCKHYKRWIGGVKLYGKATTKRFLEKQDAVAWVTQKRLEIHGEFANHGNGSVNGTNETRQGSS